MTSDHLGSLRITTDANGNIVSRRDFHPFGEDVATSQRTQALGYTDDTVRQKFTSYERDDEIDLDFAQARMYGYGYGRFTSPDPLAASVNPIRPQSWNRYSYCFNNPLRFTDPSGMITGDYYRNGDGAWIKTDGRGDGKNYLVTNPNEIRDIEQATNNGMYLSTPDDYASLLELPEQPVRREIGVDAVARSNAATSNERGARGGFAEDGGVVIETANGRLAVPAVQGAMGDPRRRGAGAEINVENPANPDLILQITNPNARATTYHVHPSGEITNRDGSTSYFAQPPSNWTEVVNDQQVPRGDIPNAANLNATPVTLGYRIVVAAGRAEYCGQRVYFYNGTGILGSMPINRFVNLPAPRPLPAYRPR